MIFRLILVSIRRITRTNHQGVCSIIRLTVVFSRDRVCFPVSRFEPDVVSPVIVVSWETDNHIVAICVVCGTQDIFIHHRDNTLHCTVTICCGIWLQSRSNHHHETDRLTTICSSDFVIRRPYCINLLSIEGVYLKVVVIYIIYRSIFNCITSYRRMLTLIHMPSNKTLIITTSISLTKIISTIRRVVCIVILVSSRPVPIQIKPEIIHYPVIVEVQHGITFRSDGHILVFAGFRQTKTSVMAWNFIVCNVIGSGVSGQNTIAKSADSIVFITVIHRFVRDILAYRTIISHIRSFHLIARSTQILRPKNDRIGSCWIRQPLGIDGGVGIKFSTKRERAIRCTALIQEPTAKAVSIAYHFFITAGLLRHITCQHKLGRIILTAFTILIKHKPVTCRKIGREHHVTGDDYRCVIRINRFCWIIPLNIIYIIRMYKPSQQRMVVV